MFEKINNEEYYDSLLQNVNKEDLRLDTILQKNKFSEKFLSKHIDILYHDLVPYILSESFIENHINYFLVDNKNFINKKQFLNNFIFNQNLSESFIKKYYDNLTIFSKLDIYKYQNLSEECLVYLISKELECGNKEDLDSIISNLIQSQTYSQEFMENYLIDIYPEIEELAYYVTSLDNAFFAGKDPLWSKYYNRSHKKISRAEKLNMMARCASNYNLEFNSNDGMLYLFANTNRFGHFADRHYYPRKVKSVVGNYYHNDFCNLESKPYHTKNSIHLYRSGNTKVCVHVDDFGIYNENVRYSDDYICLVYGFTVLENNYQNKQ